MVQLQFAVPGFSKCGTTTLCELLRKHPEIYIPPVKEPSYFAENFHRGSDWYDQWFTESKAGQLLGDGSTAYSVREFVECSAERLALHNPEIKLIFIARHPMRRLESSFREMHHSGYRYGLEADYDLGRTLATFKNMLADSHYWSLINVYRDRVPDEQMHVLFLEEFERDPGAELRRCFQFLGVDPDVAIDGLDQKWNPGTSKLYDSRLLRFVLHHQWTRGMWQRLGPERQKQWSDRLKLRRPFTRPVRWSPQTLARVQQVLGEEMRRFLTFYGRSPDHWKWVAEPDCKRVAA